MDDSRWFFGSIRHGTERFHKVIRRVNKSLRPLGVFINPRTIAFVSLPTTLLESAKCVSAEIMFFDMREQSEEDRSLSEITDGLSAYRPGIPLDRLSDAVSGFVDVAGKNGIEVCDRMIVGTMTCKGGNLRMMNLAVTLVLSDKIAGE